MEEINDLESLRARIEMEFLRHGATMVCVPQCGECDICRAQEKHDEKKR